MSALVRLYRYKSLLSGRRAASSQELMASLEISRATFKRDLAKLRDQLHVPIKFNRELGGYQMEPGHSDSELPGLWFSQQEILALLTVQQLMQQLEPGLLGAKLRPLQERLTQLMDKHGLASQDVAKRIRIVHAGKHLVIAKSFEAVAAATLARKRLKIWHFIVTEDTAWWIAWHSLLPPIQAMGRRWPIRNAPNRAWWPLPWRLYPRRFHLTCGSLAPRSLELRFGAYRPLG